MLDLHFQSCTCKRSTKLVPWKATAGVSTPKALADYQGGRYGAGSLRMFVGGIMVDIESYHIWQVSCLGFGQGHPQRGLERSSVGWVGWRKNRHIGRRYMYWNPSQPKWVHRFQSKTELLEHKTTVRLAALKNVGQEMLAVDTISRSWMFMDVRGISPTNPRLLFQQHHRCSCASDCSDLQRPKTTMGIFFHSDVGLEPPAAPFRKSCSSPTSLCQK